MLRSLYSGVSGVRTYQTSLDVIANNIANVNTTGYKASRTTFKEIYAQLLSPARAPMGDLGGVNPRQVGLGVSIASIDTLFTQGAPQATGRMTDLAINGNGFFILTDGQREYYTRAGNFTVDSAGNLVYVNGMKVMGWQAVNGQIQVGQLQALQVPVDATIAPRATSNIALSGILDSRTPQGGTVTFPIEFFDSLGNSRTVLLVFTRQSTNPNSWDWDLWDIGRTQHYGGGTLGFDPSGRLTSIGNRFATVTGTGGASNTPIAFDFTQLSQVAADSNIVVASNDGYAAGRLVEITIDDAGVIKGVFSNGLQQDFGQIALASFPNPEALIRRSDTLFETSPNAGPMTPGTPGTGNLGSLAPGFLEMSNVDLSKEFADLIVSQRALQASSRVITVSDEVLQEVVNLKR